MSKEPFEKLRHGKALCGKVFRTFVETFNWHTDFCRNLKGDGDVGNGKIKVDRSDHRHPVIRFVGKEAAEEEPVVTNDISCWRLAIRTDEDDNPVTFLADCYYSLGGILHRHGDIILSDLNSNQPSTGDGDDGDGDDGDGKILCVRFRAAFEASNDGDLVSDVLFVSESALPELQANMGTYVYPLYKILNGVPITDLRTSLKPQVVEM